jgi:Leucine-rich repeat (LRR) protein
VSFRPDGKQIVSGGSDKTVKVWDISSLDKSENAAADVPSDKSRGDAVAAIKKLRAGIKQDDQGRVVEVTLRGSRITDAGLVHLKGLANLQALDLAFTKITDSGLVHLKGLVNLQTLDLAFTKTTDEGVAELQKALPNCEISE